MSRSSIAAWDSRVLAFFFGAKLLLQLLVAQRYGYHADELYFIACAQHLAFGYVDQMPLVPWLIRAVGEVAGYGLLSLRFLPALAGATSIAFTLLLVREWNGNRPAQLIAGLAMLIAPAYLQMASLMHIPVFESLFWTLNAYLIVLIVKYERPKLWLAVGVVSGFGLLNKPTMLLWGVGLGVGLALGRHRGQLRNPWLWGGACLALLPALPNLLWQQQHGWATLEFLGALEQGVLAAIPRHLFLLGQVLYMHPFSIPIAVAGLIWFFKPEGEPFRFFAWLYLLCLVVLTAARGKPYYLAPAYPPLFAAGAVLLERRFIGRTRWRLPVILSMMLMGGSFTAPFALPILDLRTADKVIQRLLGFVVPDPTMITGDFHREYGWKDQAAAVARVFQSLSPEARSHAVILAHDYSQAGAVDFFGREWGLPHAFSGQMNYYLWGPPPQDDSPIIAFGMPRESLAAVCGDIEQAAEIYHPLAIGTQNHLPVFRCRLSGPWSHERWQLLKRYHHY